MDVLACFLERVTTGDSVFESVITGEKALLRPCHTFLSVTEKVAEIKLDSDSLSS